MTAAAEAYLPLIRKEASRLARRLPATVEIGDMIGAGVEEAEQMLSRGRTPYGLRIRGAMIDQMRRADWLTRRARRSGDDLEPLRLDALPPKSAEAIMGAAVNAEYDDDANPPRADAVLSAMERLPARYQLLIKAHYFDGKRFKEIAAALGVSAPRVSQMHKRAVAMMQSDLHGGATQPEPSRREPKRALSAAPRPGRKSTPPVASWLAAVRAVRQLPGLDEVTALLSIAAKAGLSAADVAEELRGGA